MNQCNEPNCSFECLNCPYGRDYKHFKELWKQVNTEKPIKHKKSNPKSLFF